MKYRYPEYEVDLSPETLTECRDIAQRLLEDVGLRAPNEKFIETIAKHDGVRVDGDRVRLSRKLTDPYYDQYIADNRKRLLDAEPPAKDAPWQLSCNGFSIAVIDIDTNKVRPATTADLHDLIKLYHSFDVSGCYPVTPQDIPPMMRALACFKICWQDSDRVRPFDYMNIEQTPYMYDMYQVVGKPFIININVTECFTISQHDLDIFMRYYPQFKRDPSTIAWYTICDYAMLGVTKPISSTGCIACNLTQSFGTHILFRLFDPEVQMNPPLSAGMPVDLQQMCWAFGNPRTHLYNYLTSRVMPALCGLSPDEYAPAGGMMWTGSCAVDARSGMEKMASTLTAAMQGARSFGGAGNLAIDDLFSATQLALDVEIFEYVKELFEAFKPHPDIITTQGLYDVMRDCGLGEDQYYSHMDTATKVRNLLPVSPRRPCEKLRAWMMHEQNLADRLRDEVKQRIAEQPAWRIDEDKYQALEAIYARAEKDLAQ